jgi:hypothetical protein
MTKDRHFLSALFRKDILTCRGAAAIANPLQVFYLGVVKHIDPKA